MYDFTGGIDYFPGPFVATIPAGMINASFYILIADDEMTEAPEYFYIETDASSFHYLVKKYVLGHFYVYIDDDDCKF